MVSDAIHLDLGETQSVNALTEENADTANVWELGSYADGQIDALKRPLLFRHYTLTKIARTLSGCRPVRHIIIEEYRTNPLFYPTITDWRDRPKKSEDYNRHNAYLFGRLEGVLQGLGGIVIARELIDGMTEKPYDRELDSSAHMLAELAALHGLAIEANIALALGRARAYQPEGNFGPQSINQSALEGLVNAVTRYDLSKGYTFAVYALPWISQRIECTRPGEAHPCALSPEEGQLLVKIRAFSGNFLMLQGREPTQEEIIRHLRVKNGRETVRGLIKDPARVGALIKAAQRAVPLDKLLTEGDSLMDFIQERLPSRETVVPDRPVHFPDGETMASLLSMRTFDNVMQLVLALQYDFPPEKMSPRLKTLVDGKIMTYREIYLRYRHEAQEYGKRFPDAAVLNRRQIAANVLGIQVNKVVAAENAAHEKLRQIIVSRYGEDAIE